MTHPLPRSFVSRGVRARFDVWAPLVSLVLALCLPVPVRAATIVVDSSGDVANGSDGVCTLREALANAAGNAATYADCAAGDALPTIDAIQFSGVSSIALSGAELAVSESVEIDGPVTIDGGGVARSLRILHVTAGAVTVRDVTFQNGRAAGGGAILNSTGDLHLHSCSFDHNTASSGSGGAISSSAGDLELSGVSFTDNTAAAGDGGAVWVSLTSSDLVASSSVFTDNWASGAGGAIYMSGSGTGSASIDQSSFLGNTSTNTSASKGGGAIYNAVAETLGTTISLSTFDSNIATAGQGGAIFNAAAATGTVLSADLFEANQANGPGISQGYGGAVHNVGQLSSHGSTFHGNTAARSGGALSNKAAGTILVSLSNSTLAANTAGLSGGGIWNQAGSKVETRNVTFAANAVVSTLYGGANVWNDGAFTILNTIVADGVGTVGCGPTSLTNNNGDGNVQFPAASCGAGPATIPAGDPKLGAATYDGGPDGLLVTPLGAGSVAIGAGNTTVCSSAPVSGLDQRGVARPQPVSTSCDSGAYESGRIAAYSSSPVAGSTVPITAYAGSTASGSVTVSETGTDDLIVSFVGVSGDPELTLATPTSFTVADGGAPVAIQVECTSGSVGQYDATLTVAHTGGASPSTYAVSCQVLPPPAPGYASSPTPGSTLALATLAGSPTSTDVVVSETGNAPLVVSDVSVAGDPEISLTTAGSFQIADGGPPETVTVSCSSTTGGSFAATLTVTHDAVGGPATYPVTCDVAAPGFTSSPTSGSTLPISTLAGTPATTDVVVSESGDATLLVSSVAVTGDPEIALQTASSFQISDGAPSATITVECSSAVVGQFTATLTVTHNAAGSPESYGVTCGVAPVPVPGYASSPAPGSTLSLGTITGTPTTTDVVVSETGDVPLVVTSVALSGDPELTLTSPGSFQIADGAPSATITVRCSSAQVGTYAASLTVTHNANGSPAIYPVSCAVTAAPAPGFGSSPAPGSTLALGAVAGTPDSASVTVSETGTLPLVVGDVEVTGDPEITLITASSFQIADGGAPDDVTVRCLSAVVGTFDATLTLTHNAGSAVTYPIECNVTAVPAPIYDSMPAPGATIALITPRSVPADDRIVVSDTGTAPLDVSEIDVTGDPAIILTSAPSFVIGDHLNTQDITFRCLSEATGSFSAVISVHHNAESSPAQYAVSCSVNPTSSDVRGDFDGDSKPDLIWEDQRTGALSVWLMNGAQRLNQRPLEPSRTPGPSWHVMGSGDFNADGKADLLLQSSATGAMRVWFMRATKKIGEADVTPSSINDPRLVVVAVADMNGDGRPDVLRQAPGKMPMSVIYLKGTSVQGQASFNPDKATKTSAKTLGAPDLNGDGKPDLLFALKGQLTVWYMDGVTRIGVASLSPSAAPTTKDMLVGNADFNGDGWTDLLFENRKSGALELWLMDGAHRISTMPTAPAREVDPHMMIAAPR